MAEVQVLPDLWPLRAEVQADSGPIHDQNAADAVLVNNLTNFEVGGVPKVPELVLRALEKFVVSGVVVVREPGELVGHYIRHPSRRNLELKAGRTDSRAQRKACSWISEPVNRRTRCPCAWSHRSRFLSCAACSLVLSCQSWPSHSTTVDGMSPVSRKSTRYGPICAWVFTSTVESPNSPTRY